jgi:serine protease inhibitor
MPMPDAPPVTFVADHPFLFAIIMNHNEQQQLLFIGRHV